MTAPSELILSTSSIGTYLRCGWQYALSSIYRVPAPPNMDMAVGTAVHAGVQALHDGAQLPLNALGAALEEQLVSVPLPWPESDSNALGAAVRMYEVYRANIAPTFHPTIVEQGFVIRVNGQLVSGQIDAADDQDVHDTKTTALLSRFRPERHRLQLTLYGLGYAMLTGRRPRRLLLDVIARNLRWKTVEVQPDEGELADVISLVSRGILAGEFEPTGASSGACHRCPYAGGICEYAVID